VSSKRLYSERTRGPASVNRSNAAAVAVDDVDDIDVLGRFLDDVNTTTC